MGIKKTKKTGKLPIIRCICGFEILLLPDLNAMGQAIEEHALRHQNKYSLTEEETDLQSQGEHPGSQHPERGAPAHHRRSDPRRRRGTHR